MTATCNAPAQAAAPAAVKPRYNVNSTPEAYELRVELPGVAKEGVKIDLDQSVLTIRAQRKNASPESWKPLHRELSNLDYFLRLRVNTQVQEENLTATVDSGVLTLRLPIKEAAKPRTIEVR